MNWNDIVRRNKVTTSTGRKQPRNNASDIKEIRHNAQSVIGKGCSADVSAMLSDSVVTKVQHRDVEAGVCGKTSHFRTRRHDSGILHGVAGPIPSHSHSPTTTYRKHAAPIRTVAAQITSPCLLPRHPAHDFCRRAGSRSVRRNIGAHEGSFGVGEWVANADKPVASTEAPRKSPAWSQWSGLLARKWDRLRPA